MSVSPIGDASNFMAISKATAYNIILCCVNGTLICGNSAAINHSMCCASDIGKYTCPISTWNLWSKSQVDLSFNYLISFSSIMHCDPDFGFLNSAIRAVWIGLSVLGCPPENFINQFKARSLNVVTI